jgi:hypothetical protein
MRTIGTFAVKAEADQALAHEVSAMAREGVARPAAGRPRAIHLGIRTLASLTPAMVREWNHAVTTESTRRATERRERSITHDTARVGLQRAAATACRG